MRLLPFVVLALVAGCRTADVPGSDPEPGGLVQTVSPDVTDVDDLANRLRAANLSLMFQSYSASNARAAGGASYALPDGGTVFLFEYPSADARDADVPYLLAQDGPVHVYTSGERFAAVYSGTNAGTMEALADALDPVGR